MARAQAGKVTGLVCMPTLHQVMPLVGLRTGFAWSWTPPTRVARLGRDGLNITQHGRFASFHHERRLPRDRTMRMLSLTISVLTLLCLLSV
jgi:hypothetical protein